MDLLIDWGSLALLLWTLSWVGKDRRPPSEYNSWLP